MSSSFIPPITRIGEPDWVKKFQNYLERCDVLCAGESVTVIQDAEKYLELQLPPAIREYYEHFGTTSESDFMYNLKPVSELRWLFATDWSFINSNFNMSEIDTMVVFGESPGNDPLCFDSKTGGIYLFSHDPIQKAKVFMDFSQYVVYEIFEIEQLVGDLTDADIAALQRKYLSGADIDYDFRYIKL